MSVITDNLLMLIALVVWGWLWLTLGLNIGKQKRESEQRQPIQQPKSDISCVRFAGCTNWRNTRCISGNCNEHCEMYCECGASNDPPLVPISADAEEWSEYIVDKEE